MSNNENKINLNVNTKHFVLLDFSLAIGNTIKLKYSTSLFRYVWEKIKVN